MKTIIFESHDTLARRLNSIENLEKHVEMLQKENYELEKRCANQQRELRRLNNTEKLAKKYATEVVKNLYQFELHKIKEQEETIKALREQVDYYVNKLQEIYYNETEW